eukprot:GEMP01044371.1.p1 GENE.GEMP01044371.1~~GEMP01044371.1.p1  ORF type:complete len:280 (+),score=58.06 GEMP01044371.1:68-841(+)
MSPGHFQPQHHATGVPQFPLPGQLPTSSVGDVRGFPGCQMPPVPMPNNGNGAMSHQDLARHMMEVREHMMHMMHSMDGLQPQMNSGNVWCFEFISQDGGPLMMPQRERKSGHPEQRHANEAADVMTRQMRGPTGRKLKEHDGNAMSTILEQAPYMPSPDHPCTAQWHNGSAEQFIDGPVAIQRATGSFGVRDQFFNIDGPIIGAQNGRTVYVNDDGVVFINDNEVGRMGDNATNMSIAQVNGQVFINGNYMEPVLLE